MLFRSHPKLQSSFFWYVTRVGASGEQAVHARAVSKRRPALLVLTYRGMVGWRPNEVVKKIVLQIFERCKSLILLGRKFAKDVLLDFSYSLNVQGNRRCAALSRSVQRPKGARLTAGLGTASPSLDYQHN